jgi:hypothetical protein
MAILNIEVGYIRAIMVHHAGQGETIAEVDCEDYDHFTTLPDVVSYDGIILGKTGWNSDTGRAYYKSRAQVLKVVCRKCN